MSGCQRCGKAATSKRPDDVGDTVDAESDITQAGPHRSHLWVPVSAQWRTRAQSAGSILRDLGIIALAAVLGYAIVLFVRNTPIGKPLFEFAAAQPEPKEESVAYLPSAVTLQIRQGGHTVLGSGMMLTADGLIVTNNHVVAPVSETPREPTDIVVTLSDGRTAAVRVIAADPLGDIAVLRIQNTSGLTLISTRPSADRPGSVGAGFVKR
jgi:putative serine protease PepD